MKHLETLQSKLPFELIPTNLPGAYGTPSPPKDFDPDTATSAELLKYGLFWRRPGAADHAALVNAWRQVFARRWVAEDRMIPKLEPQIGRTHNLRKQPRKMIDGSYLGSQWAGAGFKSGGPWTGVIGFWNIPTVSTPVEPQGTQGGWDSSSWIGLDGFFVSNDVLQAGVEQSVDANGRASYVAWYEWFVDPPTAVPPGTPLDGSGYPQSWFPKYQYIYQTNIPNFTVVDGDRIFCSVQYLTNNTAGIIYFGNDTTGKYFSLTLDPPPGASFNGSTVEWIMEVPDGGLPVASLPKFTPVTFSSAIACGANAIGNPQTADTINIENSANTQLTAVAVGDYTATISFTG